MKGKTVIVTGANTGIGKETARDLAKRGARVIMACRNMKAAKRACDEIFADSGNPNIITKHVDMSLLQSIRIFAQDIIDTESVVDVLIHNAGVAPGLTTEVTSDGFEITMAINYYGPFLLTHLLINMLKKSDQGRIVVVSSKVYNKASLQRDLSNMNPTTYLYYPTRMYYLSKFMEIMFTQELSRRLQGTHITANCLHPGVINTEIWRNIPFPLNILFKPIQWNLRTPEDGAKTTLYLAIAPEVKQISGKYFRDCKVAEINEQVQDQEVQGRLWEASKVLVKLTEDDPVI